MYDDKFEPIMNAGWHAHATDHFFSHPGIRPIHGDGTETLPDSNNALFKLVYQMFDIDWLFYTYAEKAETHLTAHCGRNIVLTRETGVIGVGGEYEYALPNVMQPLSLLQDALLRVHTNPEIFAAPEPDLMYIKFTNMNLRQKYSGTVHLYDPISHGRRSFNLLQFVIYLEQEMNPLLAEPTARMIASAVEKGNKPFGYDGDVKLLKAQTSKALLLANLFAPHRIAFDRIFNTITRLGSFERAWQYFTLVTQEGAVDVHDDILANLYTPEVLNQVWYDQRQPIDY